MPGARLICVGKIRTAYWQKACEHYERLLRSWRKLEITDLRDGDASLSPEARKKQEGKRILDSLNPRDFIIALHETGKQMTSPELAGFLRDCDEARLQRPAFIVGGPFGLDADVLATANFKLSLSLMTFPHELARVLLLEQIFRAETILRNAPYHH